MARTATRGAWPLFVALSFLMVGNGLQSSLVGLRADLEGFTTAVTGVVMTGYYVGFLGGAFVVPRIVGTVGHVRVYSGLASLGSIALLVYTLFTSPGLWFGMRVVSGFCMAGLYIVAESWLNGVVSNDNRGRVLSIYMVVVSGGLAAGQLLLNLADPAGYELFVLASVLVSMAVVPMALAPSNAPVVVPPERRLPFRDVYRTVPLGMSGVAVAGISGGALFGMGAVWAANSGLGVGRISLFMGLSLIGGVAFQWPLGALSDRISRRRVLFIATTGSALVAAWLLTLDSGAPLLLVAAFLFGGFSFPIYSLGVSHANDAIPPDRLVAASAVLMFSNGVGAVLGPVSASITMAALGANGFWAFLLAVHGLFGAFIAYRLVVRRSMDVDKRRFLSVPTRSTWLAIRLGRDRDPKP
ncbi:MAG TPA: MFS transporter [Acidimicrobiia bacterium]|nr:MFS transporter [Acidimicrobiia bacterium]